MCLWKSAISFPIGSAIRPFGLLSVSLWLSSLLLLGVACAASSSLAAAQDSAAAQTLLPLALFDGQPIGEDQLPAAEHVQLQRMMEQVYTVRMRALHEVLDQKLLDAEAKRKGVSVEDLIKSEVISKVPEPSDADASDYYQSRQGKIDQPFEEVRDKIRQGIKGVEVQKARMVYVDALLEKAVNDGALVFFISPPKVAMTPDPTRLRGDPKAPVTIVEFSDFSCSYCRRADLTMKELLAKYQGKVKLGYRDFPLKQLHPHAELAAEASRCAAEQNKFWEYHDLLFANPDKQERSDLVQDAATLKLDPATFDACLVSARYKPRIEQDVQLGMRGGVVATPGFFINGTLIDGAQPAATFEKIINQELSKSSSNATQAGAPGDSRADGVLHATERVP